ncbi:MAG: hypothetical protein U5K54_04015 [Cytophagales bacterium]|nr:hypothetical protein [Cytophagales bacterium]
MDKKIAKKNWTLKKIATYGGIALLVFFIAYQFILLTAGQLLKQIKTSLQSQPCSAVSSKNLFLRQVPLNRPVPFILDAIEGGNIKNIVSESGKMLRKAM